MKYVFHAIGWLFFLYGLYLAIGGGGSAYLSGLGGGVLALIGAVLIVGGSLMDGIDALARLQKDNAKQIINAIRETKTE